MQLVLNRIYENLSGDGTFRRLHFDVLDGLHNYLLRNNLFEKGSRGLQRAEPDYYTKEDAKLGA